MKLIGYIRVSTEKQVSEGNSLEDQERRIRAYCDLYEHSVVRVESDPGFSSATMNRQGLQNALLALKAGEADGIIVAKLDRLTRSLEDLCKLIRLYFRDDSKWSLVAVSDQLDTSSANGRFFVKMMGLVSEWEREIISERTKEAMQHKKSNGEFCGGGVPYGYCLKEDGSLGYHEEEWTVVVMARMLRQDRKMSYGAIARELERLEVFNRKDKPFHPEQVRRMITNTLDLSRVAA